MNKINNLFLTGPRDIGKTFIIRKLQAHFAGVKWGGFLTEPAKLPGYQMRAVQFPATNVIAYQNPEIRNKFDIFLEAFDNFGVSILKDALENSQIILMDELGVFESGAYLFQNQVFEILNSSKPVIGVIKDKPSPFLDKIRQRPDVGIHRVSLENREQLVDEMIQKILSLI